MECEWGGIIKGGSWSEEGLLSSNDVLACLTRLNITTCPVTQEQELAQLSPIQPNSKKIVPMAMGDHWMAGILREDTITIMDSDFAETRMLRVKEACRGNARIKVRYAVNTAQQPMGSSQCALHCIMNAILLYFDCAEFAPQKRSLFERCFGQEISKQSWEEQLRELTSRF